MKTEQKKKEEGISYSAILKSNGQVLQADADTILELFDSLTPRTPKVKGELTVIKHRDSLKDVATTRLIPLRQFFRIFTENDSMSRRMARIQFAKMIELYLST